MGVSVELTPKALDYVAEKGFDKLYGARPLRRAMQKYIEDPIAEEILKGSVKEGSIVKVDVATNDAELLFHIEHAGEAAKTITAHPTTIEDVMKEAGISHAEDLESDDEEPLEKASE